MINKFILMLIPVLIIGCTPQPSGQKIYKHEHLGIQIPIPDNWKPISSADAEPIEPIWEDGDISITNELYLGYYNPDSGDIEGTFLLQIWDENDPENALADLENSEAHEKINWHNRTCYFSTELKEEHIVAETYIIIKNDLEIRFLLGYSKSHAESVTNILDEIIF